MTRPRLLILAQTSEPEVPPPVDVTQLLRADIAKRDWSACHVAGDNGPRIDLPEKRRKWGWS